MDRKSFLRGFGTGILFASVILGISFVSRTSESSTISKAKKLGMVFESQDQRVVQATPETSEAPETSGTPQAGQSQAPDTGKEPSGSQIPDASQMPASKASQKPSGTDSNSSGGGKDNRDNKNSSNKDNNSNKNNASKDSNQESNPDKFKKAEEETEKEIEDMKKQLTINDGDWAGKVSKELESMGVIDNAAEFDRYLVENGYSNVINSGIYDVSPEDSYHDLAEKITSRFR